MSGGVPVAVAVNIPRLELDRPFTYLLPEERAPGTGLLVSVPFHGRTVRGWVLGPTDEVPGRVLPVRRVLSAVPVFDDRLLSLARWVAERYVTPLSVALDRLHPPRVASEEAEAPTGEPVPIPEIPVPAVLGGYDNGNHLVAAAREGEGAFLVRPLPDEEHVACLEAVATCLGASRDAVVIVPEAEPLPQLARRLADAFGPAAALFVGGDRRARYRRWLEMLHGRYRLVVGTRSAVFAPMRRLGLVWIHREAHPGHREERSPSHNVREVALARGRLEGAVCVLAGLGPSAEAVAIADGGGASIVRPARARERSAAPLVETVRPEREGRSPRLGRLLRDSMGGFLLLSQHGYGVARLCRSCGEPVRCPACSGPVMVEGSAHRCSVCGTKVDACTVCGGTSFGIDRGGTERIAEWAGHVHRGPVRRVETAERPAPGTVLVGTAAAVKDFGPLRVPLVAVLDADRARRRPGLGAPAQTLAIWMEAAAWAGPRDGGGRVLVHTRDPADPAVQALVRWDPWHLHRSEAARRTEAGFPPGFPVFRVVGGPDLPGALAELSPLQLLTSSANGEAVCLLTLRPDAVPRFRERVHSWAEKGIVARVEAEPQI
jgi:primosomal protein N' (replication factor Y)